jgi:hypothetical protein
MSESSRDQVTIADDFFALWQWPLAIGAAWAAETAALIERGMIHAGPHAQLPVPEVIAEHDEHGLFA